MNSNSNSNSNFVEIEDDEDADIQFSSPLMDNYDSDDSFSLDLGNQPSKIEINEKDNNKTIQNIGNKINPIPIQEETKVVEKQIQKKEEPVKLKGYLSTSEATCILRVSLKLFLFIFINKNLCTDKTSWW